MKSHARKQRGWYPWSYITSQYRQQTADPLRRILTRGRGERSDWPSSQGLDELSQQLVHINCRFADQSDDLSGITDDILKLQQVLNAVCESHEKSRV